MSKRTSLLIVIVFPALTLFQIGSLRAKEEQVSSPKKDKNLVVATAIPPKIPDVVEIQRELQKILEIHRTLQIQHQDQIREIQRITEQARAHQKLLKTLEASRVARTTAPVDLDDFVRLEKIRLIEKEAQKNRASIEEMQKKAEEGEKPKKKAEESATPVPAENPKPKKKSFWR